MEGEMLGSVTKRALLLVGTWDPFMKQHQQLIRQAADYAEQNDKQCVTVIVHPNPSAFIHDPPKWVTYDDLAVRIELLQKYGSSASLLLKFNQNDLSAASDEFFELMALHLRVSDLWLGADQALGTGHRGSSRYLDDAAKSRNVQLKRLPPNRLKAFSAKARHLISVGEFAAAAEVVGRPPVWKIPSSGRLATSWPEGPCVIQEFCLDTEKAYGAVAKAHLEASGSLETSISCNGFASKCMAFIAGKCDSLTHEDYGAQMIGLKSGTVHKAAKRESSFRSELF